MKAAIRFLFRTTIFASIGVGLGLVAQLNIMNQNKLPTESEITSYDNNAHARLVSQQDKILKRSRESTVRIMSMEVNTGVVASSSGTYVTMFDHHYVITTRHGILGGCETTKIIADETVYDCLKFIELNEEADYALIQVYELEELVPVKIPKMVATTKKQWLKSLSIMTKTFYTGYPNGLGPLTIDGKVIGHHPSGQIYINSYAWSGSSGSGVFSEHGHYIGYVVAIDVGQGMNGPAVIENVVLVVPAWKINWLSALNSLQQELQE